MGFLKDMSKEAEGLVAFGTISLIGIAIIIGFKDTGKVDNTAADSIKTNFSTMITFLAIGIIAVIGFAIMRMSKNKK